MPGHNDDPLPPLTLALKLENKLRSGSARRARRRDDGDGESEAAVDEGERRRGQEVELNTRIGTSEERASAMWAVVASQARNGKGEVS